ncbi:DASH complex subunit Duo1-domain-containing protein [Spinellus fusiger]|nr:DASH complex subunit Duo1-domain-containing protein [Spinellus fusiger]
MLQNDTHDSLTGHAETNTPNSAKDILLPSNRRATLLYRTLDHSLPPIEDPNNTPHTNIQRRNEYEAVKSTNLIMEGVISNFENISTLVKQLTHTVDQTEQLLDRWVGVLAQTEHTKRLLDDPEWKGSQPEEFTYKQQQQQQQQQVQVQQQAQQQQQQQTSHFNDTQRELKSVQNYGRSIEKEALPSRSLSRKLKSSLSNQRPSSTSERTTKPQGQKQVSFKRVLPVERSMSNKRRR